MNKIKKILGILVVAAGCAVAMPGTAEAAAINPIMLTDGDITQTVNGVDFTIRKDYNHPYVEYTAAYGSKYNRQLVVEMVITNHSGKAFNYTAYLAAADANGKALVNSNNLAAAQFGTIENNASATVQVIYLLTKDNDVNTFTLSYQHMDYSAAYFADMNAYLNGAMTVTDVALRHPSTMVTFTVNYPMQQPGVGGANRKSAIRGSVLGGTTTSK